MREKKVVVITGASSGIGLAYAELFAEQHWQVVLAARSAAKLDQVQAALQQKGLEALAVPTDVSVEEECKNLIADTIKHFGRIDVLINNAGISMRAPFEDVNLEVLKQLMDVNFWGTVYCTKYALPYLLETKGSVVGISSIAGFVGLPGRTGYSASKYAMHGFLESLRIEHLKTGLHVMIVAPGFTASNIRFTALNAEGQQQGDSPRNESKMMTAEQVAQKTYKALLKRKKTLILTFVEGKLTVFLKKCFPRLLERLTYNHMAKEEKNK